jgi:hypothetical protein
MKSTLGRNIFFCYFRILRGQHMATFVLWSEIYCTGTVIPFKSKEKIIYLWNIRKILRYWIPITSLLRDNSFFRSLHRNSYDQRCQQICSNHFPYFWNGYKKSHGCFCWKCKKVKKSTHICVHHICKGGYCRYSVGIGYEAVGLSLMLAPGYGSYHWCQRCLT